MGKSASTSVVAVTGSQDLLRQRQLQLLIEKNRPQGWQVVSVDGSQPGALAAALTEDALTLFSSKSPPKQLVVIQNPEKLDVKLLEEHLANGPEHQVLLLHHDGDVKENTKFGKFLLRLEKNHYHFAKPKQGWKAIKEAEDFCAAEAKRLGKGLEEGCTGRLLTWAGTELGVLAFELQKASYLAESRGSVSITRGDLRAIAPLAGISVLEVADALLARQQKTLCWSLQRVRKSFKKDPTMLASALLARSVMTWMSLLDLLQRATDPEEAAARVKVPAWIVKTKLAPYLNGWTLAELVQVLQGLAAAERAVLNGAISPWTVLTAKLLLSCRN